MGPPAGLAALPRDTANGLAALPRDTANGLAALPAQDVLFPLVLARLDPQDWCRLRAVDRTHRELVTQFLASNRRLELPYCKQLTEPALLLLTRGALSLRSLALPGCKLLTDDLLRPVLAASPHLASLDLSECHHLTSSILHTVSARCPRLARLILRDCHWVSRAALDYHCSRQGRQDGPALPALAAPCSVCCALPHTVEPGPSHPPQFQLREVDLTGCWELDDSTVVRLLASFPRLAAIRLGNIYSLTDATLRGLAAHSPGLALLDIGGCWRVTDQGVSLMAEYCPRLAELAVTDCRDITERSLARLRQRGVIVDRKLDPILLRWREQLLWKKQILDHFK